MTARATLHYASIRLYRLRLFHGRWYPTTYEQPLHGRPYGAVKLTREKRR